MLHKKLFSVLSILLCMAVTFDAFAQNGYLYDLSLIETLPENCLLVTNTEILEDNAKEINFDSSVTYHSIDAEYPMGIDTECFPCFAQAGFSEPVILGIISNTPRLNHAVEYLEFLLNNPV